MSLLFGVTPAFQLAGRDLLTPLREAGRGVSGGARQRIMRSALVVAEVALSVVLLVGASLMIRTLLSIQGANLAFHPDRILTLRIPFSEQRYPDANRRNAFLQDVLRRMQTAPGVLAVGINTGLPPVYNWSFPVEAVGSSQQETRPVLVHQTNADYPRVMGLTVLQGRFLTEAEVTARTSQHRGQPDTGAALFLRRGEAIGRLIRIPRLRTPPFNLAGRFVSDHRRGQRHGESTCPPTRRCRRCICRTRVLGRADRIFALGAGRPEALAAALKAQVYAVDPASR